MAHTRWQIVLPMTYKDPERGTLGTEAQHVTYVETICGILGGGWSMVPGYGGWRGERENYREPVRFYTFDTDVDRESVEMIMHLVAGHLKRQLYQEAVYITESPVIPHLY